MEKLLSQVREITAINGEIQKEEQTNVDVRELLRQLVDGFRMRERERVTFDLSMPEEEPLEVRASADRLMQVFENLLDNAVSFAPMCHPERAQRVEGPPSNPMCHPERAQRVEGPPSNAQEISPLTLLAHDDTSPEVFVTASGDDRVVAADPFQVVGVLLGHRRHVIDHEHLRRHVRFGPRLSDVEGPSAGMPMMMRVPQPGALSTPSVP